MTNPKLIIKKMDLQLFTEGMSNPDLNNSLNEELKNAIESGDTEAFVKAQAAMAKNIESKILEEARKAVNDDINDHAVMVKRGLNPLTAEEKTYYNEVIDGNGFDGTEKLLPASVFERVFEDLKTQRPLLSEIKFENTTATQEWITRTSECEAAWWGKLSAEIQKKLEASFKKEKTELYKLSAFVPVSKTMLDLGPQWLDRFVREILFESLAMALELAIVSGNGIDQPIGMMKDLSAPVDPVTGYADKAAVAITDLEPVTLGKEIMAKLTRGGKRTVNQALLIVNPLDYWGKIFPATTFLSATGTYVHGVLPIPAKVIESVAIPEGKMIAGTAKDYFMGVGSSQKIDYSDHYKFLEDERTYLTKQYANGKPIDNEGFLLFDISGLEPEIPEV